MLSNDSAPSRHVLENILYDMDGIFGHDLNKYPVYAVERSLSAAKLVAEARKLSVFVNDDVKATREKLFKMACILEPHKKTNWRPWADELAYYDEEQRVVLIHEVGELMDVLTPAKMKTELKTIFHADLLGKNDIIKLCQLAFEQRQKNNALRDEKRKFAINADQLLKPSQDMFVVMEEWIEKAPGITPQERKKVGLNLMRELQAKNLGIEPTAVAILFLSAAYIADTSRCFQQAKYYIKNNMKTMGEMQEMLQTMDILRKKADKNSPFYQEADCFLKQTAKKYKDKNPVGYKLT